MAKNEPWVWSVVRPDGGRTEHYRPEHAERIAAEIPGSRVVELAPVDPLARAVVEAAVEWQQANIREFESECAGGEADSCAEVFWDAVAALVAAREGA